MHKNRIKKEKQREANHAKEGERDRHGFYWKPCESSILLGTSKLISCYLSPTDSMEGDRSILLALFLEVFANMFLEFISIIRGWSVLRVSLFLLRVANMFVPFVGTLIFSNFPL
jgi:hypothetical protein